MSATSEPHRPQPSAGGGFLRVLRSEWTKLRTVRGWIAWSFAAALLTVLMVFVGHHENDVCLHKPAVGEPCKSVAARPQIPVGPGGEAVSDTYYLLGRTLQGNGSLTARVSSMTGMIEASHGQHSVSRESGASHGPRSVHGEGAGNTRAGLVPWAKAGLIVTDSTKPGSPYAAVMLTGSHGVRMQYDYTGDIASSGPPASAGSPRWLRITRTGRTLTGYESADGAHWSKVGSVRLGGLPGTLQAGMLVTSPPSSRLGQQYFAPGSVSSMASLATASFDHIGVEGHWSSGWRGEQVGAAKPGSGTFIQTLEGAGYSRSAGGFTISGSGDIAPAVGLPAAFTAQTSLKGVFIGLTILVVLASMFVTAEYRRGLIRTTLAASPRRGQVLAAKAIVIGSVAFLAGAVAAAIAIPVGAHLLRGEGDYVYPMSTLTELRVVLGTGALLALAALLALGLAAILRRSAGAVTAVIVAIVLPYVLVVAGAVPPQPARWLMSITPAAAFAVAQTVGQYAQVSYVYSPAQGFYPLAPLAGLGVLAAYTAAALYVAHRLLHSRDA